MAGLLIDIMPEFDPNMASTLQNNLINSPKSKNFLDMTSVNINRGRDHGLPPYTYYRDRYQVFKSVSNKNYGDFIEKTLFNTLKSIYNP